MIIQLFSSFDKKTNSTKRPTGTVDKSVTGTLKEPCSITNPVFKIERLSPDSSPDVYTYAIIPAFHRFYFVEDWTWADGLWECRMSVDVLATYKNDIGESTCYILRTDSYDTETPYWNPWVSDATYPALPEGSAETLTLSSPFVQYINSGIFIVGVIGSDNQDAIGAITYYALTASQFGHLKETLFGVDGLEAMGLIDSTDHTTWTATDMSEQVFKSMYNPYQYIVSCIWFPVYPASISGNPVTTMKIGWWDYSISAIRVNTFTGIFYDGIVEIPMHGQARTRGWYLNYAPYSEYTLHGKFGTVPLNSAFFELDDNAQSYKYVEVKYTVDYVTGQCLVQIYATRQPNTEYQQRQLIHKTQFLIGVPIQLAQIGLDYFGATSTAISSIVGTAKSGLAGEAIGGVVGGVAGAIVGASSGIYNTLQSAMPQLETTGSNGSFINMNLQTTLVILTHSIMWEDRTHKGRPYCFQNKIKFMTGYVQCSDGDIDINCFDNERKMIKEYLTTGFFYE